MGVFVALGVGGRKDMQMRYQTRSRTLVDCGENVDSGLGGPGEWGGAAESAESVGFAGFAVRIEVDTSDSRQRPAAESDDVYSYCISLRRSRIQYCSLDQWASTSRS